MVKRLFDIAVAFLLLCITLPVLICVAMAIRILDGSPVLFYQDRPGKNGKIFRLVKFRTMRDEFSTDDRSLPDSIRLTSLGSFLRSCSLDELPELWNVLRGDMSLIGPRPLLVEYLPLYSAQQARRHEVRPGITGWAQVNGRNSLSWEDRFALDVWYVDNHSFCLDLNILFMTVNKVLRREGISQEGEATMQKFRGSGQ